MAKASANQPQTTSTASPARLALARLAKEYGKQSVRLFSDAPIEVKYQRTGVPSIDRHLKGGLPLGKVTELSGVEGVGKTSLSLHVCRQALQDNQTKFVAYIDAETSLDTAFVAEKYGIDPERFLHIPQDTTNTAERLLDILMDLSNDPMCALVVVDSIGSLLTAPNAANSHETGQRDTLPALLQRTFKKLTARSLDSCPILMLNQLRVTQGAGPGADPYYTPGGMAMRHGPFLRLRLQRNKQIKEGETVVGFEVVMVVDKGRTVPRKSRSQFAIDYAVGVDSARTAIESGVEQGVIIKRGSMYDLFGETYKGKAPLLDALRKDEKLLDDLLANLMDLPPEAGGE